MSWQQRAGAGYAQSVGLISNATALGLMTACERRGVSRERLLDLAGLTPQSVEPESRLSAPDLHRLWSAAMELTRDEDLSIHAAEALPPGAYGIIDFLFAHAPTIGAGLERVARYFTLIHTGVRLAVIEGSDECALDLGRNADPVAARPDGEFSLAVFVLRLRQNVAGELALVRVECAYSEPRDRRELNRVFTCPLKFNCGSNRLVLSRQDWERTPVKSEPGLFRVLEDHARRVEAELPALSSLTAQVRKLLAQELKGGRPLAAHVAKRLAMSERSLQRRLKQEGETFSNVLDDLRAQHAAVYLKHQHLSQAEVAHLLGFSDVSAFHRAHRRWTGRPPGEV